MAEEQKVASVREGSQDLAPDKEMQPASEGRTWQPVLPVEPSSSPFRWGLQNPPAAFMPLSLEQSMGAPGRERRESSHLLMLLLAP